MSGAPKSVLIQHGFTAGMNQAVDPRAVAPPDLIEAENLRFPQAGCVEKRFGNAEAITTLTNPMTGTPTTIATGPGRLYALGNQLVLIDGSSMATYSPTGNPTGDANYKDQVPRVNAETRPVAGIGSEVCSDMVVGTTAAGGMFIAYLTAFQVFVVDAVTGAVIPTKSSAVAPLVGGYWSGGVSGGRLVMIGATLCLVYRSSANNISLYTLNTATWTWTDSGTTNIVTANLANGQFDVAPYSSASAILAYCDTGNQLRARRFDTSGTIVASFASAEATTVPLTKIGCCHHAASDVTHITYFRQLAGPAYTGKLTRFSWTLGETASFPITVNPPMTAAGTEVDTSCCSIDSTNVAVIYLYNDTDGTAADFWMRAHKVASSTVAAQGRLAPHVSTTSRPWHSNGITYAAAYMTPQGAGIAGSWAGIIDLRTDTGTASVCAQPVAAIAPRVTTSVARSTDLVGLTRHVGFTLSVGVADPAASGAADPAVNSIVDCALEETGHERWIGARLGSALYFGGMVCDGWRVAEHSFLHRPYVGTTSAGVGGVDAGVHNYAVVYSYVTVAGDIVESAVSNVSAITLGAANNVTVTIASYGLTTLRDYQDQNAEPRVIARVYRTTAAAPSGPFYLVNTVANNPAVAWLTYTDTTDDATLIAGTPIYTGLIGTQQSEMNNVNPPAFLVTVAHRDRLFGLAPDRRTVWFTDKLVNYEQPRWHDELTLDVDDADGLTALASLGDRLIAMSPTHCYTLDGDGPSNRFPGADSDYQGFKRTPDDAGCTQPQSVCVTQFGVFFRGAKGIYLFSRAGEVSEISAAVQSDLASYDVTTQITMHPIDKLLYVDCLQTTGEEYGLRLVYDYRTKAWSRDVLYSAALNAISYACAALGQSVFWLGPGKVYSEDRNTYLDATSTWVTAKAKLAPVQSGGPLGRQGTVSLLFSALRYTAHGLSVRVDYDHGTTATETTTFTDSAVTAWTTELEQFRRSLVRVENTAISVTISDVAPSVGAVGTGRGARWLSWALDAEPRAQPKQLPPTQQR